MFEGIIQDNLGARYGNSKNKSSGCVEVDLFEHLRVTVR